jgi:hypothetical protein
MRPGEHETRWRFSSQKKKPGPEEPGRSIETTTRSDARTRRLWRSDLREGEPSAPYPRLSRSSCSVRSSRGRLNWIISRRRARQHNDASAHFDLGIEIGDVFVGKPNTSR